jgi:hypothetical protein
MGLVRRLENGCKELQQIFDCKTRTANTRYTAPITKIMVTAKLGANASTNVEGTAGGR